MAITLPLPQVDPEPPARSRSRPGDPPDAAVLNRLESPEIQDKLRELVKLAKEQGYITFDDL